MISHFALRAGDYIKDDTLLVRVRFHDPLEEQVVHGSEALWVVCGVEANLRRKTDFAPSGAYALGAFGFRFKLSIRFKGGADENHVGLHCGTVPGPYDDALVWPLAMPFTLTLLSRGGNRALDVNM